MIDALTIAKYFLSKDPAKKLFNNNVVLYNNRKFYEGNARLNKYLFLAQVVYLAKYGKKLFNDDFVAYDNGPVVEEIMKNFSLLSIDDTTVLPSDIKNYLDKIYFSLENATYDELIDITHEDPEWIKNQNNTYNAPKMNIEKNIKEYRRRYKGLIEALKI